MEDSQIVDLYLRRNEDAIRATSEKYGSSLRSTAYRITEDEQTSEECENDTYLEAWNRIPPHEPRSYLLPFLLRIVRAISVNRCVERDRLKRSAFISELSAEMEQCIPAPSDTESTVFGEILGGVISEFLRSQPREKRLIFMQRYFFLDSVSAIAKRLRISESKVKTTLYRTRNDLRVYLIKEGYEL